nr:MAG TPA: hypothetical protein [Caudoviricetes sp.]
MRTSPPILSCSLEKTHTENIFSPHNIFSSFFL